MVGCGTRERQEVLLQGDCFKTVTMEVVNDSLSESRTEMMIYLYRNSI